MFVFYLLAVIIGIIFGSGIISPAVNKITSGISFFGIIFLGFQVLILSNSLLHVLGVIIVAIISSYASFSIFKN